MKKNNPTTNERLAKIEERLTDLDKHFTNHLNHHWTLTLSLIGVALSTSAGLLVEVLKHIWTK